ncbi:MAG: nucleoside phosphorylase-I family protein [Eubacteriales bacterium]
MNLVILSSAKWSSVFIKENLTGMETNSDGGLNFYAGKLNGQSVTLIEIEEEVIPVMEEDLVAGLDPDYVVSLGEAYSCKKNLAAGDFVISSGASYLNNHKANQLDGQKADRKLVDLGLKAAEKFIGDEGICKFVVGNIFLNPGTATTGRKLTFLPNNDVYCMDCNGYPLTQWLVNWKAPFVLVRTVIPVRGQYGNLEVTQFKWDMAKRSFWVVRGIMDGLKKKVGMPAVRKVDLI